MELNVCIWDLARKENDDNIMIVDIEISDSDTIMETMLVELDMNYIKTIRLEDHPTHESYWACKISGGYIVSYDENKLLLKYNDDGKLIQKITNAEYAIGEEYGDYYIIKENAFGWGFIGLTKKDKLNWENV